MTMAKYTVALIAAAVVMASGQTAAADVAAGKKKAQEVCAACHGVDGRRRRACQCRGSGDDCERTRGHGHLAAVVSGVCEK